MPSVPQLIRAVTINKNVQRHIVEKDYAISYLLASIAATDGLGDNLVLKGGTALRKFYFPDYRFSEDLDYSTKMIGPINQIDAKIGSAINLMKDMLNERGPFQVEYEPLILKQAHPGEQKAFVIRVQFPEQRQPLCRLKVEITIDEPILSATEDRPILHGFSEEFHAHVQVYSLLEITSEKLRALLQSKTRLEARGWGASRVCRDYYDLWNLLRLPNIRISSLISLLDQKCLVRNVTFLSPDDFVSENLLDVAYSEWNQQLVPFVPDSPSVENVISEVKSLIMSIWSRGSENIL